MRLVKVAGPHLQSDEIWALPSRILKSGKVLLEGVEPGVDELKLRIYVAVTLALFPR